MKIPDEYMERAANAKLPKWATHAAVNRFDDRVEPAAWEARNQCAIAENPATLSDGEWATTFKRGYWYIVSLEDIRAAAGEA